MSKRSSISLYLKKAVVGARGYRNAVIRILDGHRNDRRRFVTHADEKSACVSGTRSAGRAAHQLSALVLNPPTPKATG